MKSLVFLWCIMGWCMGMECRPETEEFYTLQDGRQLRGWWDAEQQQIIIKTGKTSASIALTTPQISSHTPVIPQKTTTEIRLEALRAEREAVKQEAAKRDKEELINQARVEIARRDAAEQSKAGSIEKQPSPWESFGEICKRADENLDTLKEMPDFSTMNGIVFTDADKHTALRFTERGWLSIETGAETICDHIYIIPVIHNADQTVLYVDAYAQQIDGHFLNNPQRIRMLLGDHGDHQSLIMAQCGRNGQPLQNTFKTMTAPPLVKP